MDCDDRNNSNDCAVVFPRSIRLRYYKNTLSFSYHRATKYPTEYPNVHTYKITKSSDKVTMWEDNGIRVARTIKNGRLFMLRFPLDTPIAYVLCSMLTNEHNWVVPDTDTNIIETTLF